MIRPLLSNTVLGHGIDLWLTRNSVNFGLKYTRLASNFTLFTFIKPPVCVCVCVCKLLSHVQLFVTPWIVAYQAPLSLEFSKQEYWSG